MNSTLFTKWVEANLMLDDALKSGEVKKYFESLKGPFYTEPALEALNHEVLCRVKVKKFSKSYYEYIDKLGSIASKKFTEEEKKVYMEFDNEKIKEKIAKEQQQEGQPTSFQKFIGEH